MLPTLAHAQPVFRLTRCGCRWNGSKQLESEVVINMKHYNSAYIRCNSLVRTLIWFVFTWESHFWCLFGSCASFEIFNFLTGCWLNHWTMGAQWVATPAVAHSHPPCFQGTPTAAVGPNSGRTSQTIFNVMCVGHIILEPSELFFGRRQNNSGFWRYISLNTHESGQWNATYDAFT